jgi:hypothetical protein
MTLTEPSPEVARSAARTACMVNSLANVLAEWLARERERAPCAGISQWTDDADFYELDTTAAPG